MTTEAESVPIREFVAAPPPPEGIPTPEAETATPPRRRGRPPGSKNKNSSAPERRPSGGTISATAIAAQIIQVNLFLMVFPPTRMDALDDAEISALSEALAEQANRSPRFKKALEAFITGTSSANLLMVVGVIAARRAARHGIIPPDVDVMSGALLETMTGKPSTTPEYRSQDETPQPSAEAQPIGLFERQSWSPPVG